MQTVNKTVEETMCGFIKLSLCNPCNPIYIDYSKQIYNKEITDAGSKALHKYFDYILKLTLTNEKIVLINNEYAEEEFVTAERDEYEEFYYIYHINCVNFLAFLLSLFNLDYDTMKSFIENDSELELETIYLNYDNLFFIESKTGILNQLVEKYFDYLVQKFESKKISIGKWIFSRWVYLSCDDLINNKYHLKKDEFDYWKNSFFKDYYAILNLYSKIDKVIINSSFKNNFNNFKKTYSEKIDKLKNIKTASKNNI